MANLIDLINYYTKLLIIQYSSDSQPKAQATIALFADIFLADDVFFDVENAYNLIPNGSGTSWDQAGATWDQATESWDDGLQGIAVGKQLDVIGKYVGVDRYFSAINLANFFSFITYDESIPASPPRFGFETYATFGEYDYNGTLTYDSVITVNNQLSDTDFLTLIQLKMIQNTSNFSNGQIDAQIFQFFGTNIRAEETGGNGSMRMVYFINTAVSTLIAAVIFKKLLPKPMGVGLIAVEGITGLVFAFTDYSGYQSPYGFGFSTYANYDSLAGQDLTYNQIMQG